MFARIDHELAEREALEEQRQGLMKRKQALIEENQKKKDELATLDQDLEKFIDVRPASYLLGVGVTMLTDPRPPNPSKKYLRKSPEAQVSLFCDSGDTLYVLSIGQWTSDSCMRHSSTNICPLL